MHTDVAIKGNVSVEEGLSQEGDEVAAHGHEQTGVGEHHPAGGATSHSDAITGDSSQACVFAFNGVVCSWKQYITVMPHGRQWR